MFAEGAAQLAGLAGMLFGWAPEVFWRATPAELGALVRAVSGDAPAALGGSEMARLQELFPDGR